MKRVVYFDKDSDLDKADRALAHAAHVYHTVKPERQAEARQELRKAAIAFTVAAQDVVNVADARLCRQCKSRPHRGDFVCQQCVDELHGDATSAACPDGRIR